MYIYILFTKTFKKDELRKALVFKDNEINQKNIDFSMNVQ